MRATKERTLSKKTIVYDWLLGELLGDRLKPGDRLNRRQVAADVGVSVAPVLEAMLQLENEGFLETMPRRGTRVRQVEPVEVLGRFLLREAIEVQAARIYCGAAVEAQFDTLSALAQAVDVSEALDVANWRAEIRFHSALVRLAKCQILTDAFDQAMRHSFFYMVNQLIPPPIRKRDPHAHQRLLAKLRKSDPDGADRAMREHTDLRMQALLKATYD